MDAAGNWLWAVSAGGSYEDYGKGISVDAEGNSYITGSFQGTASFGSFDLTSSGYNDIFVAKMDASGNWLWVESAGGSSWDSGSGISTDAEGNSYITGFFQGTASFGSFDLTSIGYDDIFVAKMDAAGNWLWAESAGGDYSDIAYGISTDAEGNSYITGTFQGIASFDSFDLTCNDGADIFVAKLDAAGNWLWAESAGGSDLEYGRGISTDAEGNSYITGGFQGTASFGSFDLTCSGIYDIFAAKIDAAGNWLWAESSGGDVGDGGYGISTDADGNSYITGHFYGTASFGSFDLTSYGYDIFVAKLGNDTSVENEVFPAKTVLSNYPNPFNPKTNIVFNIRKESKAFLTIYNMKGQTLEQAVFGQGHHIYEWNAGKYCSGVYYYKLETEGYTMTRKMVFLK